MTRPALLLLLLSAACPAQAQTSWERRPADGPQGGSSLFVGPDGITTLHGDGRGGGIVSGPDPGILGGRPRDGLLPPLD